jgi:hypothetical protein
MLDIAERENPVNREQKQLQVLMKQRCRMLKI